MVTWRLMYGSSSGSGYSSEYALVGFPVREWRRGGVAGFGLGEGGVNHWPTDMLPSGLVCTFMRVCVCGGGGFVGVCVGYMCGVLVCRS